MHCCPQTVFHLLTFMVTANRSVKLSISTFQTPWKITTSITPTANPSFSLLCPPVSAPSSLLLSLFYSHHRFVSYLPFCVEIEAVAPVPRAILPSETALSPTVIHSYSHPRFGAKFCYVIRHCISYIWGQIKCSFQNEAGLGYLGLCCCHEIPLLLG